MHRPLMLTALVVAGLLGLGFAPSFEAFGLNVGRVDILSSLRPEIVVEAPVDYEADIYRMAVIQNGYGRLDARHYNLHDSMCDTIYR